MPIHTNNLADLLQNLYSKKLNRKLIDCGINIQINENQRHINLISSIPIHDVQEEIIQEIQEYLQLHDFVEHNISIQHNIGAHKASRHLPAHSEIKNIIAVASGKGGVGKSTIAVNLALSLHKLGAKVGILDADIYGPSQFLMLGANKNDDYRPHAAENNKMHAIDKLNLKSMSISYLIDENSPMIWRGPMVSKALQQLLFNTVWGELDYLILDLPPGTGDIQLTMVQKLPISGVVLITTPQDVALYDVNKAYRMFAKMHIPIFGIITNMTSLHCPACDHEIPLFGSEKNVREFSLKNNIPYLGNLPLQQTIQEDVDQGKPSVIHNAGIAKIFTHFARQISININQTIDN